jgi:hypothetical protein
MGGRGPGLATDGEAVSRGRARTVAAGGTGLRGGGEGEFGASSWVSKDLKEREGQIERGEEWKEGDLEREGISLFEVFRGRSFRRGASNLHSFPISMQR